MDTKELDQLVVTCLQMSSVEDVMQAAHSKQYVPCLNKNSADHRKLGQFLEEKIRVFWVN